MRIHADGDTWSTFSGDSCLFCQPNDTGNNGDQGGAGVDSGQQKTGGKRCQNYMLSDFVIIFAWLC